MTPCPRLRAQIAGFVRMYAHLEADDLTEMRAYHYCPDCPTAPIRPVTGRDLDLDQESTP